MDKGPKSTRSRPETLFYSEPLTVLPLIKKKNTSHKENSLPHRIVHFPAAEAVSFSLCKAIYIFINNYSPAWAIYAVVLKMSRNRD